MALYPVQFTDQLRQHLKALRKKRGLTQVQAAALIGVSQSRIAEIEANPGAVTVEKLMQLLAALEAGLALTDLREPLEPGTEKPSQGKAAGKPAQAVAAAAQQQALPRDPAATPVQIRKLFSAKRKGTW